MSTSIAKLLVIPSSVIAHLSAKESNDVLDHFQPDGIVIIGPPEDSYTTSQFDRATDEATPVIFSSLETSATNFETIQFGPIQLVSANTVSDIATIATAENDGRIDTDTAIYILSGLLDLNIDTDSLTTSLDGLSDYQDALSGDDLDGTYTHLLTGMEAGYAHIWDDLSIRGVGQAETAGLPPVSCFTLDTAGHTTVESLDISKLGLRAIHGVGSATSERLRKAGLNTTQDVATADIANLASIKGLGPKKGDKIATNAKALAEDKVIRTSDTPLPGTDPIFIDIETDGLNPSIAWLIGVQDGIDGNYLSFIQTNPDKPGKAVRDFMLWFSTNASQRTLIAWNGWQFDYPVLREQITAHCPKYLNCWKHASKRDPLRWARDLNNAVLPGRTNKLEHVASALGWEHDDTGLSGAAVGRAYRHWMESRNETDELDWDRHKRYCEDDVGALAYIYQAIRDASRLESTTEKQKQPVTETTNQGTLSDAY